MAPGHLPRLFDISLIQPILVYSVSYSVSCYLLLTPPPPLFSRRFCFEPSFTSPEVARLSCSPFNLPPLLPQLNWDLRLSDRYATLWDHRLTPAPDLPSTRHPQLVPYSSTALRPPFPPLSWGLPIRPSRLPEIGICSLHLSTPLLTFIPGLLRSAPSTLLLPTCPYPPTSVLNYFLSNYSRSCLQSCSTLE